MVTWLLLQALSGGNTSAVGAATGAICGLVVITPCAGYVTAFCAAPIGMIGATSSFLFTWSDVLHRHPFFGIEIVNPLDVFSVHGVPGFIGSLLTAVFALPAVNAQDPHVFTGVLYGGELEGLLGSINAVVIAGLYATIMTLLLLRLLQEMLGADGLLSASMLFSGHIKREQGRRSALALMA